jgi:hypothetical protein
MQNEVSPPRPRPALFAVGRSAADGLHMLILRPAETPVRGPWDLHAVVRSAPARRHPAA